MNTSKSQRVSSEEEASETFLKHLLPSSLKYRNNSTSDTIIFSSRLGSINGSMTLPYIITIIITCLTFLYLVSIPPREISKKLVRSGHHRYPPSTKFMMITVRSKKSPEKIKWFSDQKKNMACTRQVVC